MKRAPLSPEAKAAALTRFHEHMRKACERMERAKAEREAAALRDWCDANSIEWVRLCDAMGPNV